MANVVINNGLSHIHTTEKGQIIKGKIEILNTDDKPQAVKVYQRDYNFNYKGQVTYKAVADVFGHDFVKPEKAILN